MPPSSRMRAAICAVAVCLIRLVSRWAGLGARHARRPVRNALGPLLWIVGRQPVRQPVRQRVRQRGILASLARQAAPATGRPGVPGLGVRGHLAGASVIAISVLAAILAAERSTASADGSPASRGSFLSASAPQVPGQLLQVPQEAVAGTPYGQQAAAQHPQHGQQQGQPDKQNGAGQAAAAHGPAQGHQPVHAQQAASRPAQGSGGSPGGASKAAQPAKPAAPTAPWEVELPAPVSGPQQTMPVRGDQMRNAKTIVDQAIAMHMGVRSAVIAVATAMQESKLTNLNYGDEDSLGLFQQRPSAGWGSPGQITNAQYAAGAFLAALNQYQRHNPGWATQPLWMPAQAVQGSAFPTAYEAWEQQAAGIVKQLGYLVRPGMHADPPSPWRQAGLSGAGRDPVLIAVPVAEATAVV